MMFSAYASHFWLIVVVHEFRAQIINTLRATTPCRQRGKTVWFLAARLWFCGGGDNVIFLFALFVKVIRFNCIHYCYITVK
jgi:hypothetical protein